MLKPEEILRARQLLDAVGPDGRPICSPEERAKFEEILARQSVYDAKYPWQRYRYDPIGYATNILGIKFLTPQQKLILASIHKQPGMLKVDAANAVGKTAVAAILVNYWYDSFNPCAIMTTAPSYQQIVEALWAQIRLFRQRALIELPMDFVGPKAPEMWSSEDHYAIGRVAEKGEAFKGKHLPYMLFVFDEDDGLPSMYFEAVRTMFKPDEGHAWFTIGNPISTSSAAYLETTKVKPDGSPVWNLMSMSALEHPNIKAELDGGKPLVQSAVTVAMVDQWVDTLCEVIDKDDAQPTDFVWRDVWRRPNAEAETVILGRRPSRGTSGVWSEALWASLERSDLEFNFELYPEIGCDVARVLGGDTCDIHGHWGGISLVHESVSGRSFPATAQRLREVADLLADYANKVTGAIPGSGKKQYYGKRIPIKIDDSGIGMVLKDIAEGYNFIGINAAWPAKLDLKYPNTRSELWFETAEKARLGGLSLRYLEHECKEKLKHQAMTALWSMDARGRRCVERKEMTKKRLGRSPDGMDAFNLAHYRISQEVASMIDTDDDEDGRTTAQKLGLFGRPTGERDMGRRERDSQTHGFRLWGRK